MAIIFYAYEYLLRILPSFMLGEISAKYHIFAFEVGNLAACYYYAYAVMQLFVGVLFDRYEPKKLLIIACFFCVVSMAVFAFCENLFLAKISRFFMGACSAFAFVGLLKIATLLLPRSYFVFIAGIASTCGLLTGMCGNLILPRFIQEKGWNYALWVVVLIGVFLVLAMLLSLPFKSQKNLITIPSSQLKVNVHQIPLLLGKSQIWFVGLAGCLFYLPLSVFGELWGVPYLQVAHQLSAVNAAEAIANIFLGWILGAPIIGILLAKWSYPRSFLFVTALLTGVVFTLLLLLPLDVREIKLLLLLLGLVNAGQIIVLQFASALAAIEYAGTSIALTNMLIMLGGVVFQPLVGWLLDFQGGANFSSGLTDPAAYRNGLLIIPIACFIVCLFTLFIKKYSKF